MAHEWDALKGTLTVRVEDMESGTASKSGKTTVLATSKGFVWYGDIGVSYNIIKRRK